jgi:hypothetical protein
MNNSVTFHMLAKQKQAEMMQAARRERMARQANGRHTFKLPRFSIKTKKLWSFRRLIFQRVLR